MASKFVVAVVGLFSATAIAADPAAPIPKEGKISGTQILSGTVQVVPLGKDQSRLSYDVVGARLAEGDLFHNATVRCIGSLTVINNSWDDETGNCITTRPDGDQVFTALKGSGKSGGEAKGTWTFIGGTGKLAGIQGSGEFTRTSLRPAVPGTSQSVSRVTGSYKLPTSSASR